MMHDSESATDVDLRAGTGGCAMGGFVSLTETLTADDFEKWFGDLSPDKQDLIRRRLPAAPDADRDSLPRLFAAPGRVCLPRGPVTRVSAWDTFSVEQRRATAEASDWEHDPANEQVRQKIRELQFDIDWNIASTEREITELEDLTPWAMGYDAAARAQMLRDDRQNLYELREQERELLAAKPPELHSVLERLGRLISRRPPTEGCARSALAVVPDAATSASPERTAGANQDPIAVGANPNKRGPRRIKRTAACSAMIEAVELGKLTRDQLKGKIQKELFDLYPGVGQTTLVEARKDALRNLPEVGATAKTPANSDKTAAKDK